MLHLKNARLNAMLPLTDLTLHPGNSTFAYALCGRLHGSTFCRVGISVPSNLPQGFRSGILSKTILSTPRNGMARNMPDMPHTALPKRTMMMEHSAFIF